jgi:anaerobic selenocysteine-containing dehydrogenase
MAEKKYTFCRICEAACGLIAEVEDNRILRIVPNREHVSSRGFACIKGLKFHELVHSPDRVEYPLKRTEEGFRRISWEQALGEIGNRVKTLIERHGKDSIGLYAGNGAGFCLLHTMFAQGFAKALGTRNVFASSTQDCSNKFAVAERMYGFPMTQPVPDFENGELFIVLGANPAVSKFSFKGVPGILEKLKGAAEMGTRIVSINPRKTETVHSQGEHLPIRPDTDVFFLLALAGEIVSAGGIDRDRVDRYMKNLDSFLEIIEGWTPERAEQVTRIPARTVQELARAFVEADGASIYCSTGINHGSFPSLCFWIAEVINAVTGNLDRRGGTLVGRGIIDFPKLAVGSGAMGSTVRSRIGNLPAVSEALPGAILPDEILTPGEGQIRGFFVTAGNPALTLPDAQRVGRALENLDLLVCIDIFRSDTAEYADYILPGITFMEHPDINYIFQSMLGITDVPHLSYSDTVVEPRPEQREETWIFVELARAAGLNFFGSRFLGGLIETERRLSRVPLLGRIFRMRSEKVFTWILRAARLPGIRRMRKNPNGILLPRQKPGSFLGERVLTEDGLVDLGPADLVAQAGEVEDHYRWELENKFRIKMINKRETVTHNSYFQNAPSCVRGANSTNYVYLNPEDAAALGLENLRPARISSENGSIVLPVRISDEIMQGSAAVPFGWGHQKAGGLSTARTTGGANVNMLTSSGPGSVDPISGMARLTGIPVTLEPADTGGN